MNTFLETAPQLDKAIHLCREQYIITKTNDAQSLLHFQIADLQKQTSIYLSSFSLQVTLKHTVSIDNLTDIIYTLTLLSYVASGFSSQAITSGAIQ